MKPAPFDYLRAASIREAVDTLARADGDGKILAGGQSLAPVLALRMARPALLVDINHIPGLSTIADLDAHTVRVGTLVRHAHLVEQHQHALLAEAARWIGHTAIRSRGTCGGSIAHADPSAELPAVTSALEATVHITGSTGTRQSTPQELFAGALDTTLDDTDLITAIDLPVPHRWGFAELARRHGDFGLVTVVAAEVNEHWRVAIGGVDSRPHRPAEAEAVLNSGRTLDEATITEAARATTAGLEFSSDIHATAGYRQAMTIEFTRRALSQAITTTMKGAA